MRKTFLMALLAALLLVSALSGCGGGGRPSVAQEIPVAGGTVTLGDKVTIYIPPGALSKSATVTIKEGTDDGQAPAPLDAALPIGGAFEIDLGGDELAKPATLEIAYDPDELPEGTPEGLVFLAYYDDEQEDWIPVVGEIDAERNVIVVQTDHLSWWNPFTWNWDAWIAVLNNVLTLNVTDFVEAVQLLTDDCPQNGQTVSVDSSKANNVIQGCVDGGESANPEVRVVNVKSFFFEVFSPNGGNEYPPAGVLGPGESLRFNLLTSEPPPLVFTAEINQRSGAYLITHLIIQMLPGLNQIGIQGSQIACITERIADVAPIAAAVESLVVEQDGAAAAEDLTRFLLDEDAVRRFISASDDCFYGAAATWSVEGIRQIGAATATIMSATDFVANYLLNYRSELAFHWTRPTPVPTPTPLQPDLSTPEGAILEYFRAYNARDFERALSMFSSCMLEQIKGPSLASGFRELTQQELIDAFVAARAGTGRIDVVRIEDVRVDGAQATAAVTIRSEIPTGFAPQVVGTLVYLVAEGGVWKQNGDSSSGECTP